MASNSTSWTPPPYSQLNFSDCKTAGAFIADWDLTDNISDISVDVVLPFLRSLVPLDWADSEPKDWTLLRWWESRDYNTTSDYIFDAIDLVTSRCDRQTVCQHLPLEGDPDLAGIGMMVSYYLVATLSTLYVIVISLNSIKALREYKPWTKLHALFEHTLNLFLDAALLFSISLLLAAIYRFVSAIQDPERDDNTFLYSQINASTVSMFSVFPPLILQFPATKLRHQHIRAFLWFLIIAFVIALTILYYQLISSSARAFDIYHRHPEQALWLGYCDLNNESILGALDSVMIIAPVVLFMNLPRWICLLVAIWRTHRKSSRAPRSREHTGLYRTWSKVWQRYKKPLRILNIIICCGTMWLLLGIFTALSVRIADAMGSTGMDRRFSVGQVLAVATFAPLMIDIVVSAIYDPKVALLRKLPPNFIVSEKA